MYKARKLVLPEVNDIVIHDQRKRIYTLKAGFFSCYYFNGNLEYQLKLKADTFLYCNSRYLVVSATGTEYSLIDLENRTLMKRIGDTELDKVVDFYRSSCGKYLLLEMARRSRSTADHVVLNFSNLEIEFTLQNKSEYGIGEVKFNLYVDYGYDYKHSYDPTKKQLFHTMKSFTGKDNEKDFEETYDVELNRNILTILDHRFEPIASTMPYDYVVGGFSYFWSPSREYLILRFDDFILISKVKDFKAVGDLQVIRIDEQEVHVSSEGKRILVGDQLYELEEKKKHGDEYLRRYLNSEIDKMSMSNDTGSIGVNRIVLYSISDLFRSYVEIHPDEEEFVIPDTYEITKVYETIKNYLAGIEYDYEIGEMLQLREKLI